MRLVSSGHGATLWATAVERATCANGPIGAPAVPEMSDGASRGGARG